jgi:hypothetical protein
MILCGGALTGASDPKVYKTNKNSNEINGGEKKNKSKNLLNSLNNIEWTGYLILFFFFFFFSTNDSRFIKTPRIKYITHADYYRQHKINEREKRAIEAISNGPRDVEIVYDVHSVCVYMFV